MCHRLVRAASRFAAPVLTAVLREAATVPVALPPASLRAFDDCLRAAISHAPPDELCTSYVLVCGILRDIRNQQLARPDLLDNSKPSIKISAEDTLAFLRGESWKMQLEAAIMQAGPSVSRSQAFMDMPTDLIKRLNSMGLHIYSAQATPATPSPVRTRRTSSAPKKQQQPNKVNIDHMIGGIMKALFVPYSPKPTCARDPSKSNNDLRDREGQKYNKNNILKVKSTCDVINCYNDLSDGANRKSKKIINVPKVKTTKAQEERAKFNKAKSAHVEKPATTKAPLRLFENAKPRYLEPKLSKNTGDKVVATNKLVPKIMSSSESSRMSSPVQIRAGRARPAPAGGHAASQDSLATGSRPRTAEPSTDSLSESQTSNKYDKYATYTKAKHSKGSGECKS